MKISKDRLREIIKEELLNEGVFSDEDIGAAEQGSGAYADSPEQANKFEAVLYRNDPEYGSLEVGSILTDLDSPAVTEESIDGIVQTVQHFQNDPNFTIEIVSGEHILSVADPT